MGTHSSKNLSIIGAETLVVRMSSGVPSGLAIGQDGTLYVAEQIRNRIQRFQIDGKFIGMYGEGGSGEGQLQTPEGLVLYNDEGSNSTLLSEASSLPAFSLFPPGILPICAAYIGQERLAIADSGNGRIQIWNANDGRFVRKFGRRGDKDDEFPHGPWDCAVDRHGNWFVTNLTSNIYIFNGEGGFERKLRMGAEMAFRGITVATNSSGESVVYVIVITEAGQFIQCLHDDGTPVEQWTVQKRLFDSPNYIIVDDQRMCGAHTTSHCKGSQRIIVGDEFPSCIWCLDGNGQVLSRYPLSSCHQPYGIAKHLNTLFIATEGNEHAIVRLDL